MLNRRRLLVDRLIPVGLRQDPEKLSRARLLIFSSAAGAVVTAVAYTMRVLTEPPPAIGLAVSLSIMLMFPVVVAVIRFTSSLRLVSVGICLALTLLIFLSTVPDGGLQCPALLVTPVLPVLATFLLGRRWGMIFALLQLLFGLGLMLIHGLAPQWIGPAPTEPGSVLAPLAAVLLFASYIAARFEAQRAEVDRLKDELLSTVSHELRTPLTSIRGALGLLKGGAGGALEPSGQELVEIGSRNTEQLLSLISDLLDTQRLASGAMKLEFVDLELGPLVKRAVQSSQVLALEKQLDLGFQGPGVPLQVHGDALRLQQVVVNLLSNAVKFSEVGGAVEVELRGVGRSAVLSVRDSGAGIPDDFASRVFERFSQADGSASRSHPGSGLGLSICRMLVEAHDGQISFESEVGRGTVFRVRLPLL